MSLPVNAHVREHRGSGLTTATALYLLAECVANPGMQINVEDHYPTKWAHVDLIRRIREIASACSITDIEYDSHRLWIKSKPRGVTLAQFVRRDA